MPTNRKRKKRGTKKCHPNLACWLEDRFPLDLPDETLILLLDPSPLDEYVSLWNNYNPGQEYVEPWRWYAKRSRGK